jgi:uncharacterized YccA/Bax inhibitor family protein
MEERPVWQSSNPALHNDNLFRETYGDKLGERANVVSLRGVVNKTALLVGIAVLAGAGGYKLVASVPAALWVSWICALLIGLGIYFVVFGKPHLAPVLAPIYAIAQGAFLGALTGFLDKVLLDMGYAVAGGVALQAFIITLSLMIAMLALYSARIIRPTRTFQAVVGVFTAGIMLTYLVSIVLSLFGVSLPFVSLGSAFAGGTTAWIGLGINVFILGIASLWLVIDFKLVEDQVASGGPKYLDWYCGFALLVTLAWIYFEAVKLVFRLAILLGGRD